ncbi:MAG: hypothetical protein C4543_09540 [Ignavibacteriales bacterium]|jgi:uncharacterized membrane protein YiaA|nr:MAG: hypothetical protein C4543_09540 [Ignavibacteriales bacterium]
MTKQQFLEHLEKGLKSKHVSEVSDIIEDYRVYFDEQLTLGKKEEDIALSLGDLESIMDDYSEYSKGSRKHWFDLVAISFLAIPLLIMNYGVLITFGASSLAFWGGAIYYLFGLDSLAFMPMIPLVPKIGFILVLLSAAMFMFSLSVRFYGILKSMTKQYLVKQAIRIGEFPQKDMYQKIFKYSGLLTVGLAIIGYFLAVIVAKDFQFWHVWEWFE